ncbi:CoA ester lyase [Marinicauda algicola]|uniref:CoA ester lyase n=1 Tax=Marinicauda algicola TaxID=2029849 RepID=A0A4S2H3N2_9PROT|nr:CoA ester lyase [Marinicauda algicola]TGY90184.1 CoA ester lyase [Marinicauda algicola]
MRSLLFVPGSRPDRFAKALAAGADAVCVDLEDAVAPDGKADAREAVVGALIAGDRVGVRVNSVRTDDGKADLDALSTAPAPVFVMVPKAETPGDIAAVRAGIDAPVIALVETAEGLRNAWDIAAAEGVSAVMFGGGDYAAELGIAMDFEALLFARSQIVAAAARARVPAIDVPWLDVSDPAGLKREAERVKALGYRAKACIHPTQLETVNAVFTPTPDEIARAQAILQALENAQGGAALLNGKLIEKPVALGARRTLEAARSAGLET